MRITKVIKMLQEIREKHGDVKVKINGWDLKKGDFSYNERDMSLIISY